MSSFEKKERGIRRFCHIPQRFLLLQREETHCFFNRSQIIYGDLVETFEPYSRFYTTTLFNYSDNITRLPSPFKLFYEHLLYFKHYSS